MKTMPNIWIDSLTTFDDTLNQIELCLSILKDNAYEADFLDTKTKTLYSNDVAFMKQFFEKAEFIVRGR
jgi:hypothetical protein